MKYIHCALLAIFMLAASPVVAADKDDAFLINKRDFKKQYPVIALSPVDADAILEMPDSVATIIEEEITSHLQKRGYTVIPSSVLGDIRKEMEKQVGGTTDPETGETNLAKLQAVRSHAYRELWFRQKPDAVATIRLSVSNAQFAKGRAEWDGVKQKVQSQGRDKGYGGSIAASSVSFAVYDKADRAKYLYYGGLEVLQRRVEATLELIPAENYFGDEKKVRKAAKIAVSPI